MKTIKSILIATTMIIAAVVSTLSAQQTAQPAKEHQWKVAVGDSVMIKRDCQTYLTGEQPSAWVYDKVHIVRQLGTKKFPEGVLLMNIYSWVCEDCLVPVSEKQEEALPTKQAQPAKQQQSVEPEPQPVEPEPQPAEPEPQPAEPEPQPVEPESQPVEPEPQPVEPEPQPAELEPQPVEPEPQPAEPEPQPAELEPQPAEPEPQPAEPEPVEPEPQPVEPAKGDSIHSQQNFKHDYDRFTIGLRGGAAGLLHKVKEGSWTCGGDILLDLQYAHYWTKDGRPVDLGLIVGLGIGYSQSGMKAAVDTSYSVTTTDGVIDYTLKADEVKENDGQIQMEIPLMFSLITQRGFFFNIGPKFMLPLYTPYNQHIGNPQINAYFPEEGVNVSNQVITGYLRDDQITNKGTDNGNQFSINIMLTAELGYEWILNSGNSFGLGVYANYGLYNSFKNDGSNQSLMNVTAPQGSTVASVEVMSATKTYATGLGYFDAGLKLTYHFNFPKKHKYIDSKLF